MKVPGSNQNAEEARVGSGSQQATVRPELQWEALFQTIIKKVPKSPNCENSAILLHVHCNLDKPGDSSDREAFAL